MSAGNLARNCRYVLASKEYCQKPVRYTMITEDDGISHRQYNTFCDEHAIKAAAQEAERTQSTDTKYCFDCDIEFVNPFDAARHKGGNPKHLVM